MKHLQLGLKTIPYFNTVFSTNFQNVKNIMQLKQTETKSDVIFCFKHTVNFFEYNMNYNNKNIKYP